jgi:hypothetical protein
MARKIVSIGLVLLGAFSFSAQNKVVAQAKQQIGEQDFISAYGDRAWLFAGYAASSLCGTKTSPENDLWDAFQRKDQLDASQKKAIEYEIDAESMTAMDLQSATRLDKNVCANLSDLATKSAKDLRRIVSQ